MFSIERLERYAATLAQSQEISPTNASAISLHARLRENSAVLRSAHQSLRGAMHRARGVTPAAEWLVDNYYVVDQHVKAVRRDLPVEFYKQLPKLARGALQGYPRVYGLAWTIVAHSDNRFELDTLSRFCRAYQLVQPLTIGELWAIAITLRIVLLDNLSRLAAGIVHRLALCDRADALADDLAPTDPASDAAPADFEGFEADPLPKAFSSQLFQRLRDQDPATTPALAWLLARIAAQNTSPDEIVHAEHQRQGAVNVSVRNIITSLRLISAVDWAKFFESVSLVDGLLRDESPFGTFDFATRDLYRHAIEDLSRGSGHSEIEAARKALDAARRATVPDSAESEPGYYLVAGGRAGGAGRRHRLHERGCGRTVLALRRRAPYDGRRWPLDRRSRDRRGLRHRSHPRQPVGDTSLPPAAGAADRCRGHRRPGQQPRGPLPRHPRWRDTLRAAVRLDGRGCRGGYG